MAELEISNVDDVEREYHSYISRKLLFIAVFVIACIVIIAISLSVNGLGLAPFEAFEYMIKHIFGTTYPYLSEEWYNDFILWESYVPRIAIAIICGCGLAICGVIMQGVLINPLADPYTTGVSDGASLGATVAIVTGFTYANVVGELGIVINAFIGAVVPAVIIIVLSTAIRMTPATTILVGVALSNVFGGLQTLVNYGADENALTEALRWGIGSFTQISWDSCVVPFIVTFAGGLLSFFLYKQLNLLSIGENSAKSLGLDVEKFKAFCLIVAAIMASALICYVGIIGFVGLLGPHLARMVLGGDNKYVLPASMLVGSFLLLLSDLISRVLIYPDELRVGLIMSVIGAPVFLYMIVRRKSSYGGVYRCSHPSEKTRQPQTKPRPCITPPRGERKCGSCCSRRRPCWDSSSPYSPARQVPFPLRTL